MTTDEREQRIREEQAAFDAQVESLAAEHPGAFVLFKDGGAISFHDTFQAAFDAGLDRFGLDEPFLVSQAAVRVPQPLSFAWDFGVMFG